MQTNDYLFLWLPNYANLYIKNKKPSFVDIIHNKVTVSSSIYHGLCGEDFNKRILLAIFKQWQSMQIALLRLILPIRFGYSAH